MPGFIEKAEELKSKGVAEIICISGIYINTIDKTLILSFLFSIEQLTNNVNINVAVNDVFVMGAWSKSFTENKHVKFVSDALGKYTHSLGLELDLTEKGLGIRSRRFALLVDDLHVKVANIEEGGEFSVSSVDNILKAL